MSQRHALPRHCEAALPPLSTKLTSPPKIRGGNRSVASQQIGSRANGGNVLATVTDMKIPVQNPSMAGYVSSYKADMKSMTDYMPGGMEMPGRKQYTNEYNFGYQGSLKDREINGGEDMYTTSYRELDTRILRWWTTDPESSNKPWESPYMSMSGNPIWFNDISGLDSTIYLFSGRNKDGSLQYSMTELNKMKKQTENMLEKNLLYFVKVKTFESKEALEKAASNKKVKLNSNTDIALEISNNTGSWTNLGSTGTEQVNFNGVPITMGSVYATCVEKGEPSSMYYTNMAREILHEGIVHGYGFNVARILGYSPGAFNPAADDNRNGKISIATQTAYAPFPKSPSLKLSSSQTVEWNRNVMIQYLFRNNNELLKKTTKDAYFDYLK